MLSSVTFTATLPPSYQHRRHQAEIRLAVPGWSAQEVTASNGGSGHEGSNKCLRRECNGGGGGGDIYLMSEL